ncbi:unnamed protein product [Sphenostylis stenocarpa]|uniref:F-box domain-containing protein n=1 Tax=Sphenostylis stenocarpa TaxID=92480 RepID=A0AA86SGR7_9FABA|nr:unnamed protein product [Sphenostylis stenocarpa]
MAPKRKQIEGELVMKRKRQTQKRRCREDEKDRISELPDCVLLYIMSFMSTRNAIQTCVLSKRWKNLCKCLTSLTFCARYSGDICFRKFVSWVLSSRDHSHSLLNLAVMSPKEPEILDLIMKYAMVHDIKHLTMRIDLTCKPAFDSLPFIFCCRSLTSLKICNVYDPNVIVIPNSLHLPHLKNLHLERVKFTATDDTECVEPFSNCRVLESLYLRNCSMQIDSQILCISNATLFSIKMYSYNIFGERKAYKIALSTPNLRSFTIKGVNSHQLSSACNLPLLGAVSIGLFMVKSSVIIKLMQGLANARILTLGSFTLQAILDDLSDDSTNLQPPCFVRLESLRVKSKLLDLFDGQIIKVLKFLLQNTQMARVDITKN